MCGIAFAYDYNGEPVNNGILNLFDDQRHRGTQGFGYYDGINDHLVHAATEDRIINQLCKTESNLILFHHRFPTSTINVKRAAHPFTTKQYFGDTQYILVHNGHIRNSWALKEEHTKLGIKYYSELEDGTFNDSEALLWDMALTLEGRQDKLKAYGGIAFICLKREGDKLTKINFGRNTNPLTIYRDKNGLALSSEGFADTTTSNTLYTFNVELKRLTTKYFEVPSNAPYVAPTYAPNYAQGWGTYKDYKRDYEDEYDYHYETPKSYTDAYYEDYEDEYETWLLKHDPEVENKALQYILVAEGNFTKALEAAEQDYENMFDGEGYPVDSQKAVLLEHTIAALEEDPEYTTEASISSRWSSLWPA
jgi:glucosamine 6-phosphate synthetase-like amidotransferase/phosphosugar isomerase protein